MKKPMQDLTGPFTFVVSCTSTHCSAKPFGEPLDCDLLADVGVSLSFRICLVPDVCYMQLLATIAFLVLVAFEADAGCLDDDAVKRENGKLEHCPFSPLQKISCASFRGALGNIWVWDSRVQSDGVKDYGSSIPSEKLYSWSF